MISLRAASRAFSASISHDISANPCSRRYLSAKTRRLATFVTFSYVNQIGRAMARWKALVELVTVTLLVGTLLVDRLVVELVHVLLVMQNVTGL